MDRLNGCISSDLFLPPGAIEKLNRTVRWLCGLSHRHEMSLMCPDEALNFESRRISSSLRGRRVKLPAGMQLGLSWLTPSPEIRGRYKLCYAPLFFGRALLSRA